MAARSAVSNSSIRATPPDRRAAGLLIGLTPALLGASMAGAQSIDIPAIVVSASQFPMDAARVGASVTVISGEQLRQNGTQSVAEALRTVPGIAVTQSGGRGTLTEVRIRGGETNQTLVLIDGIEVGGVADGVFDFADIPVDDVERIEVIRGPQSGIYGSYAQSGVISITTLSGRGLAAPKAHAKVEVGTRNTLSGGINVRGASGPAYGSVTVSDYRTDGFNVSHFGSERDGSSARTLTGKAGVDVTPYLNVEGVVRFSDRRIQYDPQDFRCDFNPQTFECPPTNPATYGFVIDGNARDTFNSFAGRLGATLTLFDGHWVQSANVKYYDDQRRGFQDDFLFFDAHGTRTMADYKSTFLFDTNVAGGERHTVTVLVDTRRETYDLVGNPFYVKTRDGLAGEYVLDLPTFTTLSGALRHDNNSAFADVTTWRAAVSQRFPTTGTRIHSSAGKGVTDPSVFELFGSPFNLPNPSLVPEQSIGWDVGVEQSLFNGRWVTDVTYFESEFTHKIELTFAGGFIYVNGNGTAKRRGIEIANTIKPWDWLWATASYTYTDAHDSAGNVEVRRPPHSAAFEVTLRAPDNRTKLVAGIVYNSVRKDFIFTPDATLRGNLPGATIARANLSYELSPWATAFVRAENILNVHYEEIFSYRMPAFAAYAGLRLKTPD